MKVIDVMPGRDPVVFNDQEEWLLYLRVLDCIGGTLAWCAWMNFAMRFRV